MPNRIRLKLYEWNRIEEVTESSLKETFSTSEEQKSTLNSLRLLVFGGNNFLKNLEDNTSNYNQV